MPLGVVFSLEAGEDLRALHAYVAREAGAATATSFTDAIIAYCESFATFPNRGRLRDDVRPGLRIVGFRRRVSIAFVAGPDAVVILGVFYAGRDPSRELRTDPI